MFLSSFNDPDLWFVVILILAILLFVLGFLGVSYLFFKLLGKVFLKAIERDLRKRSPELFADGKSIEDVLADMERSSLEKIEEEIVPDELILVIDNLKSKDSKWAKVSLSLVVSPDPERLLRNRNFRDRYFNAKESILRELRRKIVGAVRRVLLNSTLEDEIFLPPEVRYKSIKESIEEMITERLREIGLIVQLKDVSIEIWGVDESSGRLNS